MKKTLKKSILFLSVLMLIFCFACPVSAASINKRKVTLCTGQSVQLKVNGTKRKPKWYSNNKKVAIVNQSGKVTAKGNGSAIITAKIGKASYKCSFRVESPKINKTSISLYKGKTYQLKMLNTNQKYKWFSKNRSIATVASNGKVTGKKLERLTFMPKVLLVKHSGAMLRLNLCQFQKTLKCFFQIRKNVEMLISL